MNRRVETKELLAERVRQRQALERAARARWATLVAPAIERREPLALLSSIAALLPSRRPRPARTATLAG